MNLGQATLVTAQQYQVVLATFFVGRSMTEKPSNRRTADQRRWLRKVREDA